MIDERTRAAIFEEGRKAGERRAREEMHAKTNELIARLVDVAKQDVAGGWLQSRMMAHAEVVWANYGGATHPSKLLEA